MRNEIDTILCDEIEDADGSTHHVDVNVTIAFTACGAEPDVGYRGGYEDIEIVDDDGNVRVDLLAKYENRIVDIIDEALA